MLDRLAKATGGRKTTVGRDCWTEHLSGAGSTGLDGTSGEGGNAGVPSSTRLPVASSIYDCRSCLPSSCPSDRLLSLECLFQAQRNVTISRAYLFSPVHSQLAPLFGGESRGAPLISWGAPSSLSVRERTCGGGAGEGGACEAVAERDGAHVTAAAPRSCAQVRVRFGPPYYVGESARGWAPRGAGGLSFPKAPTSEISTNPSLLPRGVE